jgi:hypothetical protein
MIAPIDTSKLKAIHVATDAELRTIRARVVREALRSLVNEPGCGDLFGLIASTASDEALAKLGRLLK